MENNIYMIESCEFDLFCIENDLKFNDRLNNLNIQLMESAISQEIYTEGVLENISDFFQKIIEKLKELLKNAKTAIKTKMIEIQFQKKAKEIKDAYASHKTNLSGKKIKVFDYIKYRKDASNMIKEIHKVLIDIDKKDFEDSHELVEYTETNFRKIQAKYNLDDLDTYITMKYVGDVARTIDGYADSFTKLIDALNAEAEAEINNLKNLSHKEAAKEKTDSKNVSKISIYKKISMKLVNVNRPIMNRVAYIITDLLTVMSAAVVIKGINDFKNAESGGMVNIAERRKWQEELVIGASGMSVSNKLRKEMQKELNK